MNFFDLIFSFLILIFIALGFSNGSLRELLATFGIVIGYFGAEQFHERYLGITMQYIENYSQAKVVTYLAIFAVGLVIGIILSTLVRMLSAAGQRPNLPSRILAALMGLVKGVLICLAIYFVIEGYVPSYLDDLYNSSYTPWLQEFRKLINGINFALIQNILV